VGASTLNDFLEDIRFDLKNRGDTSSQGLSQARLTRYINSGYCHVTHPSVFRHQAMRHRFQITLVQDQGTYTFNPVSTVVMTALRWGAYIPSATVTDDAQRFRMIPKDEQWIENRTVNIGGPTRHYVVINDTQLRVSPIPSSAEAGNQLLFGAWREPAQLVNTTDQTTIPATWDEIVRLAGRWRTELSLGYRDQAEATKFDFVSLINEYSDQEFIHGHEDIEWMGDLNMDRYQESVS
jgi:hypothetical protein